jgi:hypothetical protein
MKFLWYCLLLLDERLLALVVCFGASSDQAKISWSLSTIVCSQKRIEDHHSWNLQSSANLGAKSSSEGAVVSGVGHCQELKSEQQRTYIPRKRRLKLADCGVSMMWLTGLVPLCKEKRRRVLVDAIIVNNNNNNKTKEEVEQWASTWWTQHKKSTNVIMTGFIVKKQEKSAPDQ